VGQRGGSESKEEQTVASLFQTTTDVVVRGALDGLAARHRVFANNIANVETPGFQPSDVQFEDELRRLREQMAEDPQAPDRLPGLALLPTLDNQGSERLDGNGVQPDTQVVRLTENSLTYETLIQAARMRGERLRSVITEGRR